MPTYDYRCNSCNVEFELFQSMKDKPKKKCPECGKLTLERLIGTGAGVIFKGSGFYETDYRTDSYKKGADAEKKAKADAPAAGGAPAKAPEAKPEAKAPEASAPAASATDSGKPEEAGSGAAGS